MYRTFVKVKNEKTEDLPIIDEINPDILFTVDTFSSFGWDVDRYVHTYHANRLIDAWRVARIKNEKGVGIFCQRLFPYLPPQIELSDLENYTPIKIYIQVVTDFFDSILIGGVSPMFETVLTIPNDKENRKNESNLIKVLDDSAAIFAWVFIFPDKTEDSIKKIFKKLQKMIVKIEHKYSVELKKPRNQNLVDEIQKGVDELKKGQSALFQQIIKSSDYYYKKLSIALLQGRIEQGEVKRLLDAIRRTIKQIQIEDLQTTDLNIEESIAKVKSTLESEMNFNQKLEMTIPIIPFLINYNIEIESGVDLLAIIKEIIKD